MEQKKIGPNELKMEIITKDKIDSLGIDSPWDLPQVKPGEIVEGRIGLCGRNGVGGLPFYIEILKMKDVSFRQ